MEAITSPEVEHSTQVTSPVERAKARAKARARACSQVKAILVVKTVERRSTVGLRQILSGSSHGGHQIQKFGRLRRTVPSLRCLERSTSFTVLGNTERPSYSVQSYEGEQWVKVNYDTGAATTAVLAELAEGLPVRKVGEVIVAKGQDILGFGRAKFQTVDEFGNTRKMEGHVTEVHTTCICQ